MRANPLQLHAQGLCAVCASYVRNVKFLTDIKIVMRSRQVYVGSVNIELQAVPCLQFLMDVSVNLLILLGSGLCKRRASGGSPSPVFFNGCLR